MTGTTFLYPLIINPKGETIKVVLDARNLHWNTDQSFESWPIEPLAPQLARANKELKAANDLLYAYTHASLDEKTILLTDFSSGDKLPLLEIFTVLTDYQNFSLNKCTPFSKN